MKTNYLPLFAIGLSAFSPGLYSAKTQWDDHSTVGFSATENHIVLPNSQSLTPSGRTTELPGMRPVAIALSPDGTLLATAGKTSELLIFHLPITDAPLSIPLPNEKDRVDDMQTNDLEPDQKGQISYTGLVFTPNGKRIYLGNVNESIKVFAVTSEGVAPAGTFGPVKARIIPV